MGSSELPSSTARYIPRGALRTESFLPVVEATGLQPPVGDLAKPETEIHAAPVDHPHSPKMITKFMTEVTTRFNPFSPNARSARLFLSMLPPNARQTMTVSTTLLSQKSTEPSSLKLKFSTLGAPLPEAVICIARGGETVG